MIIEATPAITSQVAKFDELTNRAQGVKPIDALLITHAHIGHYAGLLQLGKEAGSTSSIPTFVSKRMASFIETNAPWSQLVVDANITLNIIESGVPFEPIEGLSVEPIAVKHREDFSDTFALKIKGERQTILFAPDMDSLDDIEQLLSGVDIAYLDGTFYDEDELPHRAIKKVPHPFIKHSVKMLGEFARTHPNTVRFFHFNHSNPVLSDVPLQQALAERGFLITNFLDSEFL